MRQLAHDHGRPEKTYLMVLADRLFSLLPDKHKMQIVETFPPHTDPFLWQALSVKVLPEKLKASVTESLMKSAISHTENFLTLPASIEQYNSMVCIYTFYLATNSLVVESQVHSC
jgi:UDP-N-acetylglucosamine transferase subunit ALG13